MNINSFLLLDKMVQVTTEKMRLLGGLLESDVIIDDPKCTTAMAPLIVSDKVRMKPSKRQH